MSGEGSGVYASGDAFVPNADTAGGGPYDAHFFPPPNQSMYPLHTSMLPTVQNEKLKNEKEAIYQHPLFPLLTCLFEKCELATCTPRDVTREPANDVVSAESFKDDLAVFIKNIEQRSPYYVPNEELDSLMIHAITMLRFHLMELEKVHELCDNFCTRYVATLKGRMPADILGEERASSSNAPRSPGDEHSPQPSMQAPMNHYQVPSQPPYEPQTVPLPESTSTMPSHSLESLQSSAGLSSFSMDSLTQSSLPLHPLAIDGSTLTAVGPQSHSTVVTPLTQHTTLPHSPASSTRNGSTPLFDATGVPIHPNPASIDSTETGDESSSLCGSNDDGRESVTSDGHPSSGKRKVPKVFSKEAITKFRAWLFANLAHPYPSEEQKKQLANDTGLTILQVNNWFINARRRIVQPMIDQSNRAGRSNHVQQNAFRGRRSNRDSGSGTPETNGTPAIDTAASTTPYSPDASLSVTNPSMYNDLYMRSYPFASFPSAMNPSLFMPNMAMFPAASLSFDATNSLSQMD